MEKFQYTKEDLENIRKYGTSGRFDWSYIMYRMKQMNIDYASLYGVHTNEKDFSGAIKRSLKHGPKHLNKFVNIIQK